MSEEFTGVRLFLNIPAEVAHDPRFKSDKSILLFGEIYSMLNVTGNFYMGNKELAKRLRCSKNTITNCVKELVELGYITVEKVKDKDTGALIGRKINLAYNFLPITTDCDRGAQPIVRPPHNTLCDPTTTDCDVIEQHNKTVKDTKKTNFKYSAFIKWFNEQTGRSFRNTESNKSVIKARLNEGFTKQELALVVKYKTQEWKGTKWEKYLRPSTLFSNKFGDYLEAAKLEMATPVGQKKPANSAGPARTNFDIEHEDRQNRIDSFMRNYTEHPEWYTDENVKEFLEDFPEMKERVIAIERARTTSNSSVIK